MGGGGGGARGSLGTVGSERDLVYRPISVGASAPTPHDGLCNVLLLSLAFFFIMGGYMPCQNFATSLLNLPCLPVGSISIGTIYVALAFAALGAPAVLRWLGERRGMVLASLAYPVFVLSVSYIITPVVLLTSVAIGLCGGVLNPAGGAFVAKNCVDSNRGLYNGIFNAAQMGAGLPGNLLSVFIISSPSNATSVQACGPGSTWRDRVVLGWDNHVSLFFICMAAMCAAGTCALLALRPPPGHARHGQSLSAQHDHALAHPPSSSLLRECARTLGLTRSPQIRPVLLLMAYTGLSQAFLTGVFTHQMPATLIGTAMIVVALAEMAGGMMYGFIVDRLGIKPALVLVLLQNGAALFVTWKANAHGMSAVWVMEGDLFLLAALLLGLADNGVMTSTFSILGRFDEDDGSGKGGGGAPSLCVRAEDAFALLFFVNSVAIAALFYSAPLLVQMSGPLVGQSSPAQFFYQLVAVAAWETIAVACYVLC